MEDYLRVGVIASMHGVRGEVKVFPTTDDVTRFSQLKVVILDTGKQKIKLEIEGIKYFKQFAILKFKGFDHREEIELYKGNDLLVERKDAVPLEEGEYFICDIIGASVVTDEGTLLGSLTDVLQTGANDVYVVHTMDGNEVLLPCIPDCVLDVDTEQKMVKVHLMPGLIS